MMIPKIRASLAAAVLTLLSVEPASAEPCELHVWPTSTLGGATMGSWAPGLIPSLMAGKTEAQVSVLTTLLDPVHQIERLKALDLRRALAMPEDTIVIYHDRPPEPSKDYPRNKASTASCHAEFFINEIMFNRHPLYGKDILTFFMFLKFGPKGATLLSTTDRVRTKMPDFPSKVESDVASVEAVSTMVGNAFDADVAVFANRVKVKLARTS